METHAQTATFATGEIIEHAAEPHPESKKEWTAPEFKKLDIEEITANGGFLATDGVLSS